MNVLSLPLDELEINLEYLQSRLAFIDLLVQREVHRWQLAGQNPADNFRGLTISDEEAADLSEQSFGTSWGQSVGPLPDEGDALSAAIQRCEDDIVQVTDRAQEFGISLRLDRLEQSFNLDEFELDAFLICLAPALDLRYERIYGFLQDDVTRKRPTVNLILNLLCGPGAQKLSMMQHFMVDAPLIFHHLVEWVPEPDGGPASLLGQSLQVNQTIVAWLLGKYQPGHELEKHSSLFFPQDSAADRLLARPLDAQVDAQRLIQPGNEKPPILVFYGPDQAGQIAAGRQCGARLGQPLLQVDLAAVLSERSAPYDSMRCVLRDALLMGAIPFFTNWDACLVVGHKPALAAPGETADQSHGYLTPPWLLEELFNYQGPVIVASQSYWQVLGNEQHPTIYWFEFPVPDFQQRKALWQQLLEQIANDQNHEEFDIAALAGQFTLTGGQIRDAIAWAKDKAAQYLQPLSTKDLFLAARIHSNSYLGGLAHKIDPRYSWTDIVLPQDRLSLLHEIVATVRSRPIVLERWGVGRKLTSSQGIPILFSGPPGTGKTMAAEVLSNELGLDLYKIDLSTIVSKYVGETEKNLESIFNEAESSNAILFFDEADAIFGKRSEVKDAHDRYANIEISFLLQRMERYNGIAILATNLRANLDEAFTRRLQFAVEFPFPDEEHRLRIWQTLFPATVPHDANLDFTLLARQFKLAGGSIRNIIVGAAYLAAADGMVVDMSHVKHSIRRELQKMGRLVNEKEMQVLGE